MLCQVDGVKLEELARNRVQGIAILNIPSVYGGTNLWGTTKKKGRGAKDGSGAKDLRYAVQGNYKLLFFWCFFTLVQEKVTYNLF